jgi:phenylacetate-CoA ligase
VTETEYFDELETRDPELREAAQFDALAEQIANAKTNAPALAETLAKIDPADVRDRRTLAKLPVLRRADLIERQKHRVEDRDPFGGLTAVKTARLARIFAAPGPLYAPEALRPDYWRLARALFAAGFRRGNVVHNSFPRDLTAAGAMVDSAARALGCPVVPAGADNAELQVRTIADVKPDCYAGPPSFLKTLLDQARAAKAEIGCLKRALVSGEALSPSLRKDVKARGIEAHQVYATDDLGLIAYESHAGEGLIVDEWVIVEIVKPGTGTPLPAGEAGEVVVTTLNPDYPLIRFATGDQSAFMPGTSACGRTNRRLKGLLGRVD